METEVLAFLRASLSLEEGVRTRAEAQLKQLFLHPGEGRNPFMSECPTNPS